MRHFIILLLCLQAFHLPLMSQIGTDPNAAVMLVTADSLAKNKQYVDARSIYEQILPLADDSIRQIVQTKVSMMHYLEGRSYALKSDFITAIECSKKALDGFRESGDTAGELAALYLLGLAYELLDIPFEALEIYREASAIAASLGDNQELMALLRNQHQLSVQIGETEYATEILSRMDSVVNQTEDVAARFMFYNYMGDEATKQENFDLAERWYRRNDAIVSQEGKTVDAFLYYQKMQLMFTKAKKWDEALEYAKKYNAEYLKSHSIDEINYLSLYQNIMETYRAMGDSIRCFESLDSMSVILERNKEPKALCDFYLMRAVCYNTFENYERSLADAKKADEVLAAKYDEDDPNRVRALNLMASIELRAGHYDEAERLWHKYVDLVRRIYGENQIERLHALKGLITTEFRAGHTEQAWRDYDTLIDILKHQIPQKVPYLSNAERDAYWQNIYHYFFQDLTRVALETNASQNEFTRTSYDGLVLSKAFLLESDRSAFELIKSSGTEEDMRDFMKLSAIKARIKTWEKKGNAFADSIVEHTAKSRLLEAHLASRCRSFGDMTAFANIGYEEIKAKLHDGEVLIDFSDYLGKGARREYAAYLIDKGQKFPLLLPLFTENRIDSLQIEHPDLYYEVPYADTIYQLVWKPIAVHIKEGSTVYYVPSQLLFQISLESLPVGDGTLLGDHYRFVRLSSARELTRFAPRLYFDKDKSGTDAILYGGLKYDLSPADMVAEASKFDISPMLAVRGSISRGDSLFRELPESRKEIEGIEAVLRKRHLSVIPYTGMNGSEESFLNMNGLPPHILHMATHGFYYTPDKAQEVDYLRGYKDAMALSGLVMSGGNAAWLGKELPKGVLGGILTAANIARLDLDGLQMVVLSACQTGQGEVTQEGLYGLQRAFKKAGAKTLVMSLWNVSDVVTREFMIRFYKSLAGNGWDKRKAFDDARVYIRNKYPEPYYWAGFVMLD